MAPWAKSSSPYYLQTLEALGRHYKFRLDVAWANLPDKAREVILNGSGDEEVRFAYDDGLRSYEVKKPFEGVIKNLERRYRETESEWSREEIERYHDRDALRRLPGLPPQAGGAGGQDRRPAHRRSQPAVGQGGGRMAARLPASARRQAQRDR